MKETDNKVFCSCCNTLLLDNSVQFTIQLPQIPRDCPICRAPQWRGGPSGATYTFRRARPVAVAWYEFDADKLQEVALEIKTTFGPEYQIDRPHHQGNGNYNAKILIIDNIKIDLKVDNSYNVSETILLAIRAEFSEWDKKRILWQIDENISVLYYKDKVAGLEIRGPDDISLKEWQNHPIHQFLWLEDIIKSITAWMIKYGFSQ